MKTKRIARTKWANLLVTIFITIILGIPLFGFIPATKAAVTLKMSHQFPQGDSYSMAATYWADLVEKQTKGRIKFQHFYSSTLVKPPQVFDALKMGIADAGWVAISFATGKVPDFAIFEVQDSVPDDKWIEVYKKVTPILTEIFAKHDIKYIWAPYLGVQIYITKNKFLKTPDDFKGLKIRGAGRGIVRAIELWGGSPMFLDVAELYTGLQRGTVDGANMTYTITKSNKFYEAAPYVTEFGWVCSNLVYIAVNMKVWNSISPEDQRIMIGAVDEAMLHSDKMTRQMEADVRNEFKAMKDLHVYELTKEQQTRLLKLTLPTWDEARKNAGPLGNQLIDILASYRKW